jgi:regulatory protein
MRKNGEQALSPDEILSRMQHFCAYRERCPKEVQQKLRELGARGETADLIYQSLQEDAFFQEDRFAIAFAGGKFRINRWGKVRIRQELLARGISDTPISEALSEISDQDYLATLSQLIAKKQAEYADSDNTRDKVIAALVRKGFELELIFRYL